MMKGKSGVTEFYSPAIKKDMVTGYTTVPRTGWGVMVPQPLEELVDRANIIRLQAVYVALGGLIITALIGLWMSGKMLKPLDLVADAARKMKEGDMDIRITPFMKSRTKEFQDLGIPFDTMAQEIQNDRVALLTRLESSMPDETLEEIENTNLPTPYTNYNNTILVVDGSSSRRLMLTELLVKAGYTTLSAASYIQAVDFLFKARPKLILVNFIIRNSNGFRVLRTVKQTPGYDNIPVVLMFNKNQLANQVWAERQGAAGYMQKPIGEKELIRTVSQFVPFSTS